MRSSKFQDMRQQPLLSVHMDMVVDLQLATSLTCSARGLGRRQSLGSFLPLTLT